MSVEIATLSAGRELDRLVQEKVLKRKFPAERCPVCGWRLEQSLELGCVKGNCSLRPAPLLRADEPPAYSSLINMAYEVVEAMRGRGWMVTVTALPDGFPFLANAPHEAELKINRRFGCRMKWIPSKTLEDFRRRINGDQMAYGDTAQLAICRAALLAVEAEETKW